MLKENYSIEMTEFRSKEIIYALINKLVDLKDNSLKEILKELIEDKTLSFNEIKNIFRGKNISDDELIEIMKETNSEDFPSDDEFLNDELIGEIHCWTDVQDLETIKRWYSKNYQLYDIIKEELYCCEDNNYTDVLSEFETELLNEIKKYKN